MHMKTGMTSNDGHEFGDPQYRRIGDDQQQHQCTADQRPPTRLEDSARPSARHAGEKRETMKRSRPTEGDGDQPSSFGSSST